MLVLHMYRCLTGDEAKGDLYPLAEIINYPQNATVCVPKESSLVELCLTISRMIVFLKVLAFIITYLSFIFVCC